MTGLGSDDGATSRQAEPLNQRPRRFIDPHHHLWERGGQRYLIGEFGADSGLFMEPESTVYVECLNSYREEGPAELRCLGETQYLVDLISDSQLARERNVAAGYVGSGDLALGDGIARVLDGHAEIAAERFKGVRYCVAWDQDESIHTPFDTRPKMLLQSSLVASVAHLRRRSLSLDLWAYFTQLGEVERFLAHHPGIDVVLNHCGAPIGVGRFAGQRETVFDSWREGLTGIAPHEGACIKFGGLAMALAGFGWHRHEHPPTVSDYVQAWRPYFDVCLELFGPERIMFESNFPVDKKGCDYATLWSAFLTLSDGLSASEKDAMFFATAQRIYRL